jgi:hypothetical protein
VRSEPCLRQPLPRSKNVLDEFVAEPDARLSPATFRKYPSSVELLWMHLNGYGYSELSHDELERFERAFEEGDEEAFCHLFDSREDRRGDSALSLRTILRDLLEVAGRDSNPRPSGYEPDRAVLARVGQSSYARFDAASRVSRLWEFAGRTICPARFV